jgi:hypothetical protein
MPPVGFEPTIAAGERPKTYNLDRAATRTGNLCVVHIINLLSEPTCITLELDICFSYRTETSVRNRKWLNNCRICVIRRCYVKYRHKRGSFGQSMWWEDIMKIGLWGIWTEGNQDKQFSAEKQTPKCSSIWSSKANLLQLRSVCFLGIHTGRPLPDRVYTVCSLHGDNQNQKSLSWEKKKTTKDTRQYWQQTPALELFSPTY